MTFYKQSEYYDYMFDVRKRREATISSYMLEISYFMSWINSNYPDTDYMQISRVMILEYIESEKLNGKEIGTIDKKISILKSYFDFLWHNNLLAGSDPASKIKRSKREDRGSDSDALNDVDQKILNEWLRTKPVTKVQKAARDRALTAMCLYGGLTAREFQYLRLSHIETISDRMVVTIEGLERKREVIIYLGDAKPILEYLSTRQEDEPNFYLFPSSKGSPLSQRVIQLIFQKLSRDIGVHVYPRILRNTYAMNKFKEGFTREDVSALLGIDQWKPPE
ncbi:tyrosine-type recombinase/integrase [Paenibacillus sp. 276b]|uniref:tyrosine-type recombinase/integrase n=1 Tax=Paenibacillus sp. 276b TaxID=1566277 RepID=UPI00089438C5|nr:tyrosine-type recombinase/integrase [Paenibacillus sp. 276b]SEB27609.1 Site-specific recombinase XerD [Paenibacillus sp. 276b]